MCSPLQGEQVAANEETANEEAANEETANEETANEETANEETANEETANEETANEETANEAYAAPCKGSKLQQTKRHNAKFLSLRTHATTLYRESLMLRQSTEIVHPKFRSQTQKFEQNKILIIKTKVIYV
jgi:hypothetical protein